MGKKKPKGNRKIEIRQNNVTSKESFLTEAQSAVDKFDYEAAAGFYLQGLENDSKNTDIMDALADCYLQLSQADETQPWLEMAKNYLEKSVNLSPYKNPSKWLSFAQLHDGKEAVAMYGRGIQLLVPLLENLKRQQGDNSAEIAEVSAQLCSAYCAVAEIYLTDLCFEGDAEEQCQASLDSALSFDQGGPEVFQVLASFKMSQCKYEEALSAARESCKRLESASLVPVISFRITLGKLALECTDYDISFAQQALEIFHSCLEEDDENIEIWFLAGVALFKMDPPDLQGSQEYLEKAIQMFEKLKEDMGEGFCHDQKVALVQEQLELVKTELLKESMEIVNPAITCAGVPDAETKEKAAGNTNMETGT